MSNILTPFHYLKIASELFQDVIREDPNTLGAKLSKKYLNKIDWCFENFITFPHFPQSVRDGVKHNWNSDLLSIPAITEKINLITPEQRELVEAIIDAMIEGEEIVFSEKM